MSSMCYIFILLFVFQNNYLVNCEKCSQSDYKSCALHDPIKCVPIEWWCDGHRDCESGIDENNCTATICHETEISCKFGTQCIPKFLCCDGLAQCLDQSDEEACGLPESKKCDFRTQFDCDNDGEHCVPLSSVCDGNNDCGRNQDESPGGMKENCQKNDCKMRENGGCSHFCTNLFTNSVCHCRDGFRLLDDRKTCVDIDECSLLPAKCSQICKNTAGSYQCFCHEGFILNSKVPGECIVRDGDRSLLVSLDDGEIVTFNLDSNINIVHNISTPSNGWSNIDIYIDGNSKTTVYWSKFTDKSVGQTVIKRKHGSSDSFQVLSQHDIFHLYNGSFCGGLSYDWLRTLLFWTSTEGLIYVTNTTSNKTNVFLDKDLESPRSIVVDPFETRIYWIDLGKISTSARIEMMLMNSEDRRIIVKSGLRQPQGLVIDFLDKRLYWTDINPGTIEFISLLRPLTMKTLFSNKLLHPFSVSIFENKVFWTDRRHNQVISAGKTIGDNLKIIIQVSKPMAIGILNDIVKPNISQNKSRMHSCINNLFHYCSDICLPSPPSYHPTHKCICDIGSMMSYDNRVCNKGYSPLVLPRNIHRLKIISTVMISLILIFIVSVLIILTYSCRGKLCKKSYIMQKRMKHNIVTGDLMYIFRCQSHSSVGTTSRYNTSQLSELITSDFNSVSTA